MYTGHIINEPVYIFFQKYSVLIRHIFKLVTTHSPPELQVVLWSIHVMLGITWLREWRAGDVTMRDSGWERNLFVRVSVLHMTAF